LDGDATAEINLDDLDLGVGDFGETEVAGSFDLLDETGVNETISETGVHEALGDPDTASAEGDATEFIKGLGVGELEDTGMGLAADETGQLPVLSIETEQQPNDLEIDDGLLEETGLVQALSPDSIGEAADVLGDEDATMLAPSMGSSMPDQPLAADAETMLAPLDDDADDFDFARTENLPPEALADEFDLDATAETPAIAGTDVDLDLDDLTAALQVSEIGDSMAQVRDDATADQPRPVIDDIGAEAPTMELTPADMSSDLNDARTMTEVGTKLDLARAYVDMGDPAGARSILEEVLDEGDGGQKQQAQQLLDSLPS
jgi:pilus assembly protein FimV